MSSICDTSAGRQAERAGFEPAVGFDPHAALAKCRTDGTTHDSADTSAVGAPPLTGPLTGRADNGCEPMRKIDPDLACIVSAWPDLPPHIRAAMLALVQTAH